MGLFDDLKGQVFQAAEGAAQSMLSQAVAGAAPGGMGGLLATLQSSGMGEHVASWLSANAQNLPISADQLKSALGNEQLGQIAASMGLDPDKVAETLAEHLPALAAAHQDEAAG
ncbi:MAG TPA: YidB family protein [Caulobacteraceae bacterium]|jgi:uncharacterized protein YidB (DUF937 family)|nr:YidB family protein [Caulobacteraceae bacterium]